MTNIPQAAVFVLPTQSISKLLETQHTTSVIIRMMMYSLVGGGLKETVTAWDSSAESGGSQKYCQLQRGMILCYAQSPQSGTKKTFLYKFCGFFLFFKKFLLYF